MTKPAFLKQVTELVKKHLLDPLIRSKNPPGIDARGVAVGLLVGIGIPVGAHTAVVGLLRLLLRFNLLAGFAFTWVCNPFTIFPLYYFCYWLGSLLLGRPIDMSFEAFRALMHSTVNQEYFWGTLVEFAKLGQGLLVRWLIGAGVVAIISATAGYVITLRIQTIRCQKVADKKGLGCAQYIELLEKQLDRTKEPAAAP